MGFDARASFVKVPEKISGKNAYKTRIKIFKIFNFRVFKFSKLSKILKFSNVEIF